MSESCDSPCTDKITFPKRPENRPALGTIDYRIGDYHAIRKALFRSLNLDPTLQAWTHRKADDPGIALLEGSAILGDILTFYQNHYANECYLRTAKWQESVSGLVSLLGYRLSPAVGGKAAFALELKDGHSATIPKGFPIKADLEYLDKAAEFETTEELVAHGHTSRFNLYRSRSRSSSLAKGSSSFEIFAAGDNSSRDAESIEALGIKAGTQIIIVADSIYSRPEIVKVREVEVVVDRFVVHLESPLQKPWSGGTKAHILNRSFRHFGHSAPRKLNLNTTDTNGKITDTKQFDTSFHRYLNKDGRYATENDSDYPSLNAKTWALDQEIKDIASGTTVICTGRRLRKSGNTTYWSNFTTQRAVTRIQQDTLPWGNLNGPTTQLTLDDVIFDSGISNREYFADIRRLELHEVSGAPFQIRPVATGDDGAFGPGPFLFFHGTQSEALAFVGRQLLFTDEKGRSDLVRCESTEADFIADEFKDAVHQWRWKLKLSSAPQGFTQDDFDEAEPSVTVFGNIVEADQGRRQPLVAIGSGDQRKAFQTFALPKQELTYHLQTGATPVEVPELDLYVDGRKWERVETFYGQTANAPVYIVRSGDDGKFYVQFGNGRTGARLPTGKKNVQVAYRVGTGAYGPIKEGKKAQAIGRIEGLKAVQMPMEANGGSDIEDADNAREAAPGKIQSLGRLVSLQDYESEALAIPGVRRARASWGDPEQQESDADLFGSPAVLLTLLMDRDRQGEFDEVTTTLQNYESCRGASRQTILTHLGRLRRTAMELQFGLDPAYLEEDVRNAIMEALGVQTGEEEPRGGLFAPKHRTFGQAAYLNQVEALAQHVDGVNWAKLVGWQKMALSASENAEVPSWLQRHRKLSCSASEILQLHRNHFILHAAPAETQSC